MTENLTQIDLHEEDHMKGRGVELHTALARVGITTMLDASGSTISEPDETSLAG